MVATLLALPVLVASQRPKDQYTLEAKGRTFVVRNGARTETVDAVPPSPRASGLSFRRDARWAVWDVRGLTTRDGEWASTDRFEAVPVSPRVAKRTEILATLVQVKAGRRSRAAAGLSGARRIGPLVYLLPRWDDSEGKPWLEALVVVDLGQPHPKPRLLGTFGGLSLGKGALDDRLGIAGGALSVAVNEPSAWGFATYDLRGKRFGFEPRGVRLAGLEADGRIVETTSYGTTLAGRIADGRTVPWLETRGPAEFVPGEGPILLRCGGRLHNAVTGAELRLPDGATIRRTNAGLLVFWPEKEPRSARLLDPSRLEERARWEKGTLD